MPSFSEQSETLAAWARFPGAERLPEGDDRICLTFDDGPDENATPEILDALEEAGIRATFFVVGEQLMRHHAIAREALARGHELALHGFEHVRHDSLPGRLARDDVARAIGTFEIACGRRPRFFRPPYGLFNEHSHEACADLGLEPAYWSAWGLDWEPIPAQRIADLVVSDLEPGAIVVLHDSARYGPRASVEPTVAALAQIADAAARMGIELQAL